MKPVNLKCENTHYPLGLDTRTPTFGFAIKTERRGVRQTAYHVLVASNPEKLNDDVADCWDSGWVASDESQHITYAGKPLTAKTRYFWKVRIQDEQKQLSNWSDVHAFETAMFDRSDWSAKWIAASDAHLASLETIPSGDIPLGQWLVPSLVSRMYFRKRVVLNGKPFSKVRIQVQCDNTFHLSINNRSIALPDAESFMHIPAVDVSSYVKEDVVDIAIMAFQTNRKDRLVSALRAGLLIEYTDGTTDSIISDDEWKCGNPIKLIDSGLLGWFKDTEPAGWQTKSLSDKAWQPPCVALQVHPRLYWRSCYFRKCFHLEQPFESARAYIAAYGSYELYINGKKVGGQHLTPGHNEKYLEYQTYDITEYLTQGANVVGIITGTGWEGGYWYTLKPFEKPAFCAQLELEDKCGERDMISSDETWQVHPSPVLENSMAWGERYDAGEEIKDWLSPILGTNGWMPADTTHPQRIKLIANEEEPAEDILCAQGWKREDPVLIADPCEPIRITAVHSAISVKQIEPGRWLLDFGQNAAGRCRMKTAHLQKGDAVMIRYAERLNEEGSPHLINHLFTMAHYPSDNNTNGPSPFLTKNTDYYIAADDAEPTWMPCFSYTGFRYAEITGHRGPIHNDTVEQVVFHSDLEVRGSFNCDNALLNRIWDINKWTLRSNLHSGPTDCPTREKAYWLGDAHLILPTYCWYMDTYRLYSKWMAGGPKLGGGAGWVDSNIIIPWILYLFFGDRKVLEDNYAEMKALVEHRIELAEGDLYLSKGEHCWSDHMATDKVSTEFFSAAHHVYALKLIQKIATILKYENDADRYSKLHQSALSAFHERFYNYASGTYELEFMSSQSIPLGLGLVPTDELATVTGKLAEMLKENDYTLTSGFFGNNYTLPALTENGYLEEAYRVVTQTNSPSWGHLIENGFTTFPEGLSGCGSQNHASYGSVCSWFFEYLAGIRIEEDYPGFKRFKLKPYLPIQLKNAQAEFHSKYGKIVNSWTKKASKVTWKIIIPPNTNAVVSFPCNSAEHIQEKEAPLIKSTHIKVNAIVDGRLECIVPSGEYVFELPIPSNGSTE